MRIDYSYPNDIESAEQAFKLRLTGRAKCIYINALQLTLDSNPTHKDKIDYIIRKIKECDPDWDGEKFLEEYKI